MEPVELVLLADLTVEYLDPDVLYIILGVLRIPVCKQLTVEGSFHPPAHLFDSSMTHLAPLTQNIIEKSFDSLTLDVWGDLLSVRTGDDDGRMLQIDVGRDLTPDVIERITSVCASPSVSGDVSLVLNISASYPSLLPILLPIIRTGCVVRQLWIDIHDTGYPTEEPLEQKVLEALTKPVVVDGIERGPLPKLESLTFGGSAPPDSALVLDMMVSRYSEHQGDAYSREMERSVPLKRLNLNLEGLTSANLVRLEGILGSEVMKHRSHRHNSDAGESDDAEESGT